MKLTTTILALAASLLPCAYALPALPVGLTCDAALCLPAGTFADCAPSDAECLCALPDEDIKSYITTVEPCVRDSVPRKQCTPGGAWSYRQFITDVCATQGKKLEWNENVGEDPNDSVDEDGTADDDVTEVATE